MESSSVSPFLTQRRVALTPHQPHCETEELLALVPQSDREHLDSRGRVCMSGKVSFILSVVA